MISNLSWMSQKICKKKGLHEKSISLNNEKKSKIFKQLIRSLDKDLMLIFILRAEVSPFTVHLLSHL